MIALVRYQTAILLRSHRWVFPLIFYGLLISVGAASSMPLAEGLGWIAAMLVPVVAFLTRSMLTAEPDAVRACVAAAAGPGRAQLAALLTALGGGLLLAVAGACFDVLTAESVAKSGGSDVTGKVAATLGHPGILAAGLVTGAVCLLVGSAVGTVCNPPVLRHPGVGMLATLAAAIVALASGVSPANAALRHSGGTQDSQSQGTHWPGMIPLLVAVCLLAIAWTTSVLVATRREKSLP